jgi:hypothetical protein
MALDDEDRAKHTLEICGANDDQTDAISSEGFDGMSDLLILEDNDITR